MSTTTTKKLITPEQAAERLAVSTRSLRRLLASGAIPHCKIGRSVRIDPSDLDAYVEAAKTTGPRRERKQPVRRRSPKPARKYFPRQAAGGEGS